MAAVGPAEAGDGEDVGLMMVILCGGSEDWEMVEGDGINYYDVDVEVEC